jgi:hypothetical protein
MLVIRYRSKTRAVFESGFRLRLEELILKLGSAPSARGAAPAPFVVTSAGEIEACRCLGNDVDDAHGSIHHRKAAKSPYKIFRSLKPIFCTVMASTRTATPSRDDARRSTDHVGCVG